MKELSRWPLLLMTIGLVGAALGIDITVSDADHFAIALMGLALASGGAFIYAEGARHREWWSRTLHPEKREREGESSGDHDGS